MNFEDALSSFLPEHGSIFSLLVRNNKNNTAIMILNSLSEHL